VLIRHSLQDALGPMSRWSRVSVPMPRQDVSLVACVGTDAAADEALAMLRDGGVDLDSCLALDGTMTGTALIAVSKSGENHIVVAPGANQLSPTR